MAAVLQVIANAGRGDVKELPLGRRWRRRRGALGGEAGAWFKARKRAEAQAREKRSQTKSVHRFPALNSIGSVWRKHSSPNSARVGYGVRHRRLAEGMRSNDGEKLRSLRRWRIGDERGRLTQSIKKR